MRGNVIICPLLLPLKEKIKQHSGNCQAAGKQEHALTDTTVVVIVCQNADTNQTGDYSHDYAAFRPNRLLKKSVSSMDAKGGGAFEPL